MGHIRVSHPTGRLKVVPICSRQIGRQLKLLRPLRHALPNNQLSHSLQVNVRSHIRRPVLRRAPDATSTATVV